MRGGTVKEHLKEKMEDPEFQAAWRELDEEFDILEGVIEAREKAGLAQEELARRNRNEAAGPLKA